MRKVVVVGGGASGMMAAITAARAGAAVTVLEARERLGKKLGVTGNGRCNGSNTHRPPDAYRGGDPLLIEAVLSSFSVTDTVAFFTSLGIYSENLDGYLYPHSFQAQAVVDVLSMELAYRKVKVKTQEEVVGVERVEGEGIEEGTKGAAGSLLVRTRTWQYPADAVIFALGSPAGGGMEGYGLLKKLGFEIVKPLPALTALSLRGTPAWAGVRVRGTISLWEEVEVKEAGAKELDAKERNSRRLLSRDQGELQLIDGGVSGIPAFNVSRYGLRALDEGRKVWASLDFLPEFDQEGVLAFLTARERNCPYKGGKEQLIGLFPEKLAGILSKRGGTKEGLAAAIKDFRLPVTGGASLDRAQAYAGGVCLSGVDPFTLESLTFPGVYFCGEILDVDGRCGGYNLQWAWSSGHLAGSAAAGVKGET